MRAKAANAFARLAATCVQTDALAGGAFRHCSSWISMKAAGSAGCLAPGIDESMKSYYNIWYDFILEEEETYEI